MAYKNSSALLAAIFVLAGPAFAQETEPTTQPEATDAATQESDDSTILIAGSEAEAETDAEAATEEQAEAETATEAPAEEPSDATSEDATTADAETAETPAADAEGTDEPAADAGDAEQAAAPAEDAATAPTEPQIGAYYLKTTHGDWTIRCIKAAEGQPDPCELYQLLKDGSGNSVAEVTMIPLAQGEAAAGATIVAPLETDLVRGLGLKIDNAAPRGYPFNFCAPVGCVSRMGFDAAGLSNLKRGNSATVSLLPFGANPENPVELPMSLTGFTAAFTDLEGIVKEAQAQLEASPAPAATEAAPADEAPAAEEAPASN